jgi:hypothetical protein
MAAVAHRAGDRAAESEAWLLRASAGLELGDPRFLLDLDEFVRLATAAGQPHHTYLVLTRRANAAIITGSFSEAERLIAEPANWQRRSVNRMPGTCRPGWSGSCAARKADEPTPRPGCEPATFPT